MTLRRWFLPVFSFLWSVSSAGSADAFIPEPADPPDLAVSGSHGPEPYGSYDLPIIQPCGHPTVPVAWPCGQWGSPGWPPSGALRLRLYSSSRFPSGLTRPFPARQCIPFNRILEMDVEPCYAAGSTTCFCGSALQTL
jgi:hypothetical protein